jgi:hypothetical protein
MTEVSKGAIQDRRIRVEAARGIIRRLGLIEFRKAAGMVSFNLGVSDEKAREYIRILRDSGQVVVEGGMVSMPKKGGNPDG